MSGFRARVSCSGGGANALNLHDDGRRSVVVRRVRERGTRNIRIINIANELRAARPVRAVI